jgi:glycosyltransferase involved in cell wall biosynthesis
MPEDQVIVVHNGINATRFLKLEQQTLALYRRLDLGRASPILLLPARITPRKNIELALRVLAQLRTAHPRAALVVTGPLGPHNPANADYAAQLQALRDELRLQDSAHFLADLIDKELPDAVITDFYHLADALFFPSREEGFGIPLLEAALAHLPVFCSDIHPLRRLGEGDVHYFSPDADAASVAGLVAKTLTGDPRFRMRLRVRQDYAWEGIYEQHIAHLLEGR